MGTAQVNRLLCVLTLVLTLSISGCSLDTAPNANRRDILDEYQPAEPFDATRATAKRLGDNDFAVSISAPVDFETAKNPAWDWAAGIAAVMNAERRANGLPPIVTQELLVTAFVQHDQDQQIREPLRILAIFNPKKATAYADCYESYYKRKANGERDTSTVIPPPTPRNAGLIREISAGRVVLALIEGDTLTPTQSVLVVAVRYSRAATDRFEVFGAIKKAPFYLRSVDTIDLRNGKRITIDDTDGRLSRIRLIANTTLATQYFEQSIEAYSPAR